MKDETMLKGTAVRDYSVQHETFGFGVERLQNGAAISHVIKLDLSPGVWFLNVTVTVGVSNVSAHVKMKDQDGVKTLGGHHNGAMSPHFSAVTIPAFFDDVKVAGNRPAELIVSFESVGPNAIPMLGQRNVFVMAWKHGEPAVVVQPVAEKKPAAAAKPAEKPVEKKAEAAPAKAAAKPGAVKAEDKKVEEKPAPEKAAPEKAAPVKAAKPAAAPAAAAPAPVKPAAKPAAAPSAAAPVKSAKPAPAKKAAGKRK
jgi:hypothetical protein